MEAVKILEVQPRGTLLVSSWHSIGSQRPSHFSTEAGTPPPPVPSSTCIYAPHHALPQQLTITPSALPYQPDPAPTHLSVVPIALSSYPPLQHDSRITVVVAKVPPPPPTTVPPPPPTSPPRNCDPSYPDVCLNPNAEDYDCAGGSGNGPLYVEGPISVSPPDPFDLDADSDGVGCERD